MAVELPSPAFRMFRPAPDLQRYVKVMYLIETPYVGIKQFIPGWNKPLLVLQYHDPVFSDINGVAEAVQSISVSGITSKRYGFYTPFRERADLLSDLSTDATPLIPSRRRRLICEALAEVENVNRKAHIVEEFLRSLIPDHGPRWVEQVLAATEYMRRQEFQGEIDEVVHHVNMSGRTFRRAFKEVTGVTAKTFQRIGRFERVFDAFMMGDPGRWIDAVYDEAFYDQAHFVHDFKSFTGYAPRELPKENYYMYHILTQPGFGE